MDGKAEEKLLAELFLNLKGSQKKREDWITIAKKCKRLVNHYRSYRVAAQRLGVSSELVRSILSLLSLPQQAQALVKDGKILFDAAQRLARIPGPENQIRVANLVVGLRSHDARQLIQYAKKFPDADLDDFRKRVATPKTQPERIDVVVLPMGHELFDRLQREGARKRMSVQRLILELISESILKNPERLA
jgi:hypothetical protein